MERDAVEFIFFQHLLWELWRQILNSRFNFRLKLKILPDVNHWKQQVFSMSFDTVRIYVSFSLEYWHKNILVETPTEIVTILREEDIVVVRTTVARIIRRTRKKSKGSSFKTTVGNQQNPVHPWRGKSTRFTGRILRSPLLNWKTS